MPGADGGGEDWVPGGEKKGPKISRPKKPSKNDKKRALAIVEPNTYNPKKVFRNESKRQRRHWWLGDWRDLEAAKIADRYLVAADARAKAPAPALAVRAVKAKRIKKPAAPKEIDEKKGFNTIDKATMPSGSECTVPPANWPETDVVTPMVIAEFSTAPPDHPPPTPSTAVGAAPELARALTAVGDSAQASVDRYLGLNSAPAVKQQPAPPPPAPPPPPPPPPPVKQELDAAPAVTTTIAGPTIAGPPKPEQLEAKPMEGKREHIAAAVAPEPEPMPAAAATDEPASCAARDGGSAAESAAASSTPPEKGSDSKSGKEIVVDEVTCPGYNEVADTAYEASLNPKLRWALPERYIHYSPPKNAVREWWQPEVSQSLATDAGSTDAIADEEEWVFACACGVATRWDSTEPTALIGRQFECGKCGTWAHSECYARYRGSASLPDVCVCHKCALPKKPRDRKAEQAKRSDRQSKPRDRKAEQAKRSDRQKKRSS